MAVDLDQFRGYEPALKVKQFRDQNKPFSWQRGLHFLLDQYPQEVGGRLRYVIDGSAAVRIYAPEREDPRDIDLITSSETLAREFSNSKIFDAKSLAHWLEWRGMSYSLGMEENLLGRSEVMEFEGREVRVLGRVALAASKVLPYLGRVPRVQDEVDVSLLRVLIANPDQARAILIGS